ncbi:sulfotransferase 1E1-like [Ixodes scapularis]
MNEAPKRTPYLQMIDGVPRTPLVKPEMYCEASRFKPTAGDVILITHPKSGTHWVTQIVLLILNKGQSPRDLADLARQAPFIEANGVGHSERPPRLLRTHLPFGRLQYTEEARYIYVARNPYDTCVSFYHHVKGLPQFRFQDGTFEDFVDAFINGRIGHGDQLEHVLSGYAKRHQPNVFFLTYEGLKAHTARTVLELAKFLGEPYATMFERENSLMDEILLKSSVGYMKKMLEVNPEELPVIYNHPPQPPDVEAELLKIRSGPRAACNVRNGTSGDWRSHFTPELLERMEAWIGENTRGSDLMGLWGREFTASKLTQPLTSAA